MNKYLLALLLCALFATSLPAQTGYFYNKRKGSKTGLMHSDNKAWMIKPVYDDIKQSSSGFEYFAYRKGLIDVYKVSTVAPLQLVIDSITQLEQNYRQNATSYTTFKRNGRSDWFFQDNYPKRAAFDSIQLLLLYNGILYQTFNGGKLTVYDILNRKIVSAIPGATAIQQVVNGPFGYYKVKTTGGRYGIFYASGLTDLPATFDSIYAASEDRLFALDNSTRKISVIRGGAVEEIIAQNEAPAKIESYVRQMEKDKYAYIVSGSANGKTIADMEFFLKDGVIGIRSSDNKVLLNPSATLLYLDIGSQDFKVSLSRYGDSLIAENQQQKMYSRSSLRLLPLISNSNNCSEAGIIAVVGALYNNHLYLAPVPLSLSEPNNEIRLENYPRNVCTSYIGQPGELCIYDYVCPVCKGKDRVVTGKGSDTTTYHRSSVVRDGSTTISNYSFGGYRIDAGGNIQRYTVTDAHTVPVYKLHTNDIVSITEYDKTDYCPLLTLTTYKQYEYNQMVDKKHEDHYIEVKWDDSKKFYSLLKYK